MSAEYSGKIDHGSDGVSKTVPILPRPLVKVHDWLRALILTGDATGSTDVSFDDGMFLQGLDPFVMRPLEAQEQATADRFRAVDEAFYD